MRRSLLLLLCLLASPVLALTAEEPLPDAAQEARAKMLFAEFRCVVCQSESLADSPSDIASAMRVTIRDHIAADQSDEAIRTLLITQYGNFILMRPPLEQQTWLLWFGPWLALLAGGAYLLLRWRRTR